MPRGAVSTRSRRGPPPSPRGRATRCSRSTQQPTRRRHIPSRRRASGRHRPAASPRPRSRRSGPTLPARTFWPPGSIGRDRGPARPAEPRPPRAPGRRPGAPARRPAQPSAPRRRPKASATLPGCRRTPGPTRGARGSTEAGDRQASPAPARCREADGGRPRGQTLRRCRATRGRSSAGAPPPPAPAPQRARGGTPTCEGAARERVAPRRPRAPPRQDMPPRDALRAPWTLAAVVSV